MKQPKLTIFCAFIFKIGKHCDSELGFIEH